MNKEGDNPFIFISPINYLKSCSLLSVRESENIMTQFVKVSGMYINTNSIDMIYPYTGRSYAGGYTMLIGGKEFHLDRDEAEIITSAITIPASTTTSTTPATTATSTPAITFRQLYKAISEACNAFNEKAVVYKATVLVDKDKIKVEYAYKTNIYSEEGICLEKGIIREELNIAIDKAIFNLF